MKPNNSLSALLFAAILATGAFVAFGLHRISADVAAITVLGVSAALGYIVASSIQVADRWNKAIVLRLGRSRLLEGPVCSRSFGLFSPFLIGWPRRQSCAVSHPAEKSIL